MSLISQQYRIFAYDPCKDDGAFGNVGDVWARSEEEALQIYKAENEVAALLNGKSIHLIARAHSEKHRWPDMQTGMLPHSDNPVKQADFERGHLGGRMG